MKDVPTHIKWADVPATPREGYTYRRFVQHGPDVPFNFLRIEVDERHKTRRVTAGIRLYHVITGRGTFTVDDETFEVASRDLIVIQTGQTYSYEAKDGQMQLAEFNAATDGRIDHEDIE